MSQLKRYNGTDWETIGGLVTGDTLPLGTEVDYDGEYCPAGWVEINDPEKYSTSETLTNKTWIDGKPIYRKVLSGTTTTTNAEFQIAHGISNYDIIMIDNKSFVKSVGTSTFIIPINCPSHTSSNYNNWPVKARIIDGNVQIYIGGYNGYTSYDYAIILEYTKAS